MKPLHHILAAGLALALLSPSAHAITYPVFADTAGSPVTNLLSNAAGAATTLPVTAKSTVFINFGMTGGLNVPAASEVKAARLILYFPKVTKAGNLNVFVAGANSLGTFREVLPVGVKTQSLPSNVAPIAVNPSFGIGFLPSKNFFFLDVTAEVKSWLSNPGTEFGFGISGDATVSVLIGSKEGSGTGYPAVLEVDLFGSGAPGPQGPAGPAGPAGTATIADGSVTAAKLNLVAGKVGIGTSSPSEKLTVQTANDSFGLLHTNADNSVAVGTYIDVNSGWFGTQSNHPLHFFTNNSNPLLSVSTSGKIGIGISTPTKARLEIQGFSNTTFAGGNVAYIISGSVQPNTAGGIDSLSIYASNEIASSGYVAFSDARIKTALGRSDGSADLLTLTGIEITDYHFKDLIGKGSRAQKKVIAQQVEKVFPQAVSQSTGVVPDIYEKAAIKDGWVTLATSLKVGDRVKLITEKADGIHEVLEVRDDAFRTDFQPAGDQVFVFGREVEDFRAVDYEAIAMLNVSATQELARKLQAKDAEIATLMQKLAALEARDQAREARLTRLENGIDNRAARTVRAALDLK